MTRIHAVTFIALSQVALSFGCSSGLPHDEDPGATGGAPFLGEGGASATGGRAGAGGAHGLPACGAAGASGAAGFAGAAEAVPPVQSYAFDASDHLVGMSVHGPVTVVSADQVVDGKCAFALGYGPGTNVSSTKLVLEAADQRRWTVCLRIPNLPADFIRAGDTVDLSIDAQITAFQGWEQMISLSTDGHLLAFTYRGFQLVSLDAFGIAFSDGGALCAPQACGFVPHTLHVTHGADAADVREGETRQLGDLSFTLSQDLTFETAGLPQAPGSSCDASNLVVLGGVIAPQ